MRAHRDAAVGQQADRLGQPGGALELDHVGAGLHQQRRIVQGLLGGRVGHERQVGDDHRAAVATLDAGSVVGHIGDGDRQGAVVTLQDHAERVADQQHLDACIAGRLGEVAS